ncbi:arginase [Multifurca ochricompacta]|uniref:Arginase n=1 Tax=Multifurca ochricompacta TaxID=376703 RepID=A0AAD4MAX8_9AGAM|nr:arginase [Multifurca ochricompacta]
MDRKLKFIAEPKTVSIVGCPFSGGQHRVGVDKGPIHLVNAGLVDQLKDLGWVVEFDGHHQFEDISADIDPQIGKLKNPRLVSRVTEAVARVVGHHVNKGSLPLTLGGDHSLAMGTISGTLSNIHGMPLAFLTSLSGSASLGTIEGGEKAILREHNIAAFSMHEVDRYGIGRVVEMALDRVNPDRSKPIHLSFDVDALDPSVAPSTGTPVRGGLTFREGHYICERLYETGLCVYDWFGNFGIKIRFLKEVNPYLKEEADVKQTIAVGCSLVRAALGETLL